jgi:hypothetical protein
MAVMTQIKKALNAFLTYDQSPPGNDYALGPSSSSRPDRPRQRYSNERSIINSVCTRLSMDVAAIDLRHVKLDKQQRYLNDVDSRLNLCFELEPNIDQGPRAFRQNIASMMLDKGVAAIVPVDTSEAPEDTDSFEIYTMRVGEIVQFYHHHVKVRLYNERVGEFQEIVIEKRHVAVIENPLHSVMNEPNSTFDRLTRKLNVLDDVDAAAGRLDMIIQLPYSVRSETQQQRAEKRRDELEFQLKDSQYGIAYADGAEKIIQLNRGVDNQLLKQVEYLTQLLYSQLGITEEVMSGMADEKVMLNYHNRTVEPIVDAIREGMQRAFLGALGIARGERIRYYKNPFKLVPIAVMAEIADKFSRNEILTPNEIRSFMGIPPSSDPNADTLMNSNMPAPASQQDLNNPAPEPPSQGENSSDNPPS